MNVLRTKHQKIKVQNIQFRVKLSVRLSQKRKNKQNKEGNKVKINLIILLILEN